MLCSSAGVWGCGSVGDPVTGVGWGHAFTVGLFCSLVAWSFIYATIALYLWHERRANAQKGVGHGRGFHRR